jgi:aspartyl-tRNA(Asn)/glutamyl-tRNA(Gln) amidotransferase subunit C
MVEKRLISEKEVEHVAWLARLELSQSDKKLFTEQFNEIISYFKKIDEAKTEGVEPTYHVIELANVLREDQEVPPLLREEALRNAPKKEKGYIKAPKMV